jgi:hypothetical protein
MAGVKRLIRQGFVRPGLVIAVAGHAGLLLTLLIAGTGGAFRPVAPAPITVEILPSDETRQTEQIEGTPLESTSRGSEVSSESKTGSASTGAPRPRMEAPPLQPSQARTNPQGGGSPAAAAPQAAPPGEGETPPPSSAAQISPGTAAVTSEPRPDEAQKQPDPSEMMALPILLPGGRVGSGFDDVASDPAMLPHDDTAAFRARLGSCSKLPDWVGANDNAAILLRVSFKRDGTLASPPVLVKSSLTAEAVALTTSAIDALQRCQPFTELPKDKYARWKTMDLVVTPLTLSGR